MRTMERLRQTRRRKKMTPSPIFVIMLLILVILIAGFLFINSTYFTVGSVIVEGNKYLATEDVFHVAGISEKINIFRLDTTDIKRRLLQDLRIGDVQVNRQFPSTIVIKVTERQPLAYVANTNGFVQLDQQGIVLATLKNIKQINVPIITGIRLSSVHAGDKMKPPRLKEY